MEDYLQDIEFLQELDKYHLRTQYARISLLTFDEKIDKEIEGRITSGNVTVNAASASRRTISLSMIVNPSIDGLYTSAAAITSLDNEITLHRKMKIAVGLKNPLKNYDDIIWFPCGLFIVTGASVSRSTSGWNVSINGRDKMCLLDGTVGGTLPASTTFHEMNILDADENITIEKPTISKIIYEAVAHWGNELIDNIIINDLEETVRVLVKYVGKEPLHFSQNYESFSYHYDPNLFPHTVTEGDDAGYEIAPFTYPGKLVLNAGQTVKNVLDEIVKRLGNFEYFYDLDGRFIFQQIANYMNTGSPLNELEPDDYTRTYDNQRSMYSLTDLETTTQINFSPKYENLKNDFHVWGERTTSSGIKIPLHYHLAIDEKPRVFNYANKHMWLIYEPGERDEKGKLIKDETWIRYEFTDSKVAPPSGSPELSVRYISAPGAEWREELYRRALVAQVTNGQYNVYYDSELLAYWRSLYDPNKEEWQGNGNWNPDVSNHPKNIAYWLDFIDEASDLGKYSISQIGRRTKVINNTSIKSIYNKEVPDIIFLDGYDEELVEKYSAYGQDYFILTPEFYALFDTSSTGVSCFDQIRELMYQNLDYNASVTITCLPKYYLEPNNIIYIEDKKSGIKGNYQITQFSLPLAYNGTMSITANQVEVRV